MSGLVLPPRLRRGSQVAVIAPAGPLPDALLDAGLEQLRSWGLVVAEGAHVRDTHDGLGYLAGTDEDRAADFTWAWSAPFDAVLAARGGYGCQRMADLIPWEKLKSLPPKVFAGSSDITALHQRVAAEFGLATVFGPMVGTRAFSEDLAAREHLRYSLLDPASVRVLGRGHDPIRGGVTEGVTVGGTVSLLAADVGTGLPVPGPGTIALLEDVNEEPYRLDGLVTHLLRAGWFDQVAGIALGSWHDCGPLEEVRAVLADRLGGLGVPVAWEVGFGHCEAQLTVPMGVPVRLDADAGTLTLL
ncbi:muramoyltetrapeptide carboxypeptidase [Crossiella equi]|uniref:Muramoyltetrapeptide carboxypeptidase n=1 Tax=Crossiella equi TaxID=130796 RepID=A0ABS5A4D4_9PSEU|nr:LD-carboxypeptidase [Crossiella equi]MBP2471434.1 muramoyltetrapeptide carboxypeptidase [Crossiella equi]